MRLHRRSSPLLHLLLLGACTSAGIEGGLEEAECSDGIDNDDDGLVDCEAPTCAASLSCAPSSDEKPVVPVEVKLTALSHECEVAFDEFHVVQASFDNLGLSLRLRMMLNEQLLGNSEIEEHPFPALPSFVDPAAGREEHTLTLPVGGAESNYRPGEWTAMDCRRANAVAYALLVDADGGATPDCFVWGTATRFLEVDLGRDCITVSP